MKVYSIDQFEKLKINPISLNDFDNIKIVMLSENEILTFIANEVDIFLHGLIQDCFDKKNPCLIPYKCETGTIESNMDDCNTVSISFNWCGTYLPNMTDPQVTRFKLMKLRQYGLSYHTFFDAGYISNWPNELKTFLNEELNDIYLIQKTTEFKKNLNNTLANSFGPGSPYQVDIYNYRPTNSPLIKTSLHCHCQELNSKTMHIVAGRFKHCIDYIYDKIEKNLNK